ncbi:RagB/SusD family nutrient uptake outer membrane protein [Chryseobacterium vrystaatense]|uniref:SusD family protein n=1 Tax=Chryseobacterium vrystaatense TaxID=307480 RepID=A0A1M4VVP1_9FLAO|nr:RagB/SusD family nutrient uptake outer membrane protein [Chryseobacterium vrystaatense]KFF27921.1 hypothetical protein IW16_01490 [Chryseobacterium vrystaatense]SHE73018.1 SusD family protein [Chryseobacterium vrystaatense]
MKKILYSLLAISTLSLVSCKDDFLESSPTETLSTATVEQKVKGLYTLMIRMNTGNNEINYTGASPDHTDFGQKGWDIYTDMMSGDMALEGLNYGWYSTIASTDGQVNPTNNDSRQVWRSYYRMINAANEIIDILGGTNAVPTTAETKQQMAQAKAIRAYAYFNLLQMYTPKYNATAESIPLYTSFNPQAGPKATQEKVYAQIVDDLTKSIDYFNGFTREFKGQIDQGVAKGILAYVYAAMGKNAESAVLAKSVISDYGYPLTTRTETYYDVATSGGGGFNDVNTKSWMWGYDIVILNGLDLVSWWGMIDIFTYGYASVGDAKGIDANLYDSIGKDAAGNPILDSQGNPIVDVRKLQFSNTDNGDYSDYIPMNKFFNAKRIEQGQRQISDDYLFMRVDEFYLLAAETLAKSGQEAEAKTILKQLLDVKMYGFNAAGTEEKVTGYINALSGVALQKEIYKQTRLELWGEGKAYMAMKRNQGTMVRGANHKFLVGVPIQYDDNRMYFKIPQSEVDNNPNF